MPEVPAPTRPARRVLAIGAHPDDIELGCAGALLAHRQAGDDITMLVVTGGERGPGGFSDLVGRRREQEAAADLIGAHLYWGGLRDCSVEPDAITVELIEEVMDGVGADLIYVHAPEDSHQDHRAIAVSTLGAARRLTDILHYQSPSTLRFDPTVFVDIADHLDAKLAALHCHRSQVELSAMVEVDAISAAARYWGSQARVCLAEGFTPARMIYDITGRSVPTRTPDPARAGNRRRSRNRSR